MIGHPIERRKHGFEARHDMTRKSPVERPGCTKDGVSLRHGDGEFEDLRIRGFEDLLTHW
jgi:hypothetical protein